jgi:hypothetical protein
MIVQVYFIIFVTILETAMKDIHMFCANKDKRVEPLYDEIRTRQKEVDGRFSSGFMDKINLLDEKKNLLRNEEKPWPRSGKKTVVILVEEMRRSLCVREI